MVCCRKMVLGWVGLLVIVGCCLAAPAAKVADKKAEKHEKKEAVLDEPTILNAVKAPAGFDLTVFAHPPEVNYPTSVSAAPNGDLYVAIDENGSLDKVAGRGRVVKCVDTDGDGKADKFVTFAKMQYPRGVIWDDGKVYVLHPPFLSVYYDDNGDGVADRSEILVKGISNEIPLNQRGADHTTNGIRLGIDGWIYIAMGDFGCNPAIGKDGAKLTMHCGGVVRVRTDGSGLEMYSNHQRNIYDVAVSPTLDVFTRDNTNDGGGWNDRLSYIVPTGNYGYPSFFKNFRDEHIPCLVDFGGGSPCGSLYLDEPGFPGEWGHGFYTVEWGRSDISRHAMDPDGANYKPKTEKLMGVQRGTDMDVDGQSRLYISSWAQGGFKYSGENVGYVIRLTPQGYQVPKLPDWKKAGDTELVQILASPSAVWRLITQREILKRGNKPVFVEGLQKLASSNQPIPVRVAAIFTLQQLLGPQSHDILAQLSKTAEIREYALRALADRSADGNLPAGAFVDALKDTNPRVRLVAAWGLGRIGKKDNASATLPLIADSDPLVAHVAVNSLVLMQGVDECMNALDPATPKLIDPAIRVLQSFHQTQVVSALVGKLDSTKDPALRSAIYRGLCRLYYQEAQWDGSWWGTRPDTSGPYFKAVEWQASSQIKEILQKGLTTEKPAVVRNLLVELQRHKIDFPELTQLLVRGAASDSNLKGVLVEMMNMRTSFSPEQMAWMSSSVMSETEAPAFRAKVLRVLQKNSNIHAAFDAVVNTLVAIQCNPKADPTLVAVWDEIVRDPRNVGNLNQFTKLAETDSGAKRDLAWAVIVHMASSKVTAKEYAEKAAVIVDKHSANQAILPVILHAVGVVQADRYAPLAESHAKDSSASIAKAAAMAVDQLKAGRSSEVGKVLIESLPYDKAATDACADKGDAKLGQQLFTRLGCVACHTVSADQPLKGPLLAGIATRYSRPELCESILKPSAKIEQGFETQWFKRKGEILEGFIVRESGDEIELRQITGVTITIRAKDVKDRGRRDVSVMPTGLVDKFTTHDLASLLAYLESISKN